MHAQTIDHYLSQKYPVVLTPLKEQEGGGWFAEIKELPGCMADGETPQEAMESIEESKRLWITTAVKHGRSVPLPETDEQDEYSGRLTLRMPKSLHRKVADLAKREGISLNQFLLSAVAFQGGLFESKTKRPPEVMVTIIQECDNRQQDVTHLVSRLWPQSVALPEVYRGGGRESVREAIGAENRTDTFRVPKCEFPVHSFRTRPEKTQV